MNKRGSKCAIYGCTNYKMQREAKSFYRFPKNKELCKQWIARTKRTDLVDVLEEKGAEYLYKSCLVCSDHFAQRDFRNKNLLSQGIYRDTVPSLKLDCVDTDIIRLGPQKRKRDDSPEFELIDVSCKSTPEVEDATMNNQTKAEMPGHRCMVFGCNDGPRKSGRSVAYHVFPANRFLRDNWIKRCGRHENFNADRSYVCSAHFKEDDYEKNVQAQTSWSKKCILKSTAVPTLELNTWSRKASQSQSSNRGGFSNEPTRAAGPSNLRIKPIEEIYLEDVQVKIESEPDQGYGASDIKTEEVGVGDGGLPKVEEELVIKIEEVEEDSDVIFVDEFKIETSEDDGSEADVEDAALEELSADRFEIVVCDDSEAENSEEPIDPSNKMKYHTLVQSHNRLLRRVNELENELILSQSLAARLKEKVTSLEHELREAKEQTVEDLQLKAGIGDVLSKSQINFGVLKKKNVFWTPDDLTKAFTIRYLNSRCYVYLRDTLKYPLPGISSLQRWVSKINLQEGILSGILRLMKIAGYAMTDFERTVVLHFDELKVRSVYEYDEVQDEVLGPHSTMQVIMARGLFSDWKQPIYVGFDNRITEKSLLDVVKKLHDATYNVVACTSGCSKANVELWNDLSISAEQTYILHPITKDKIYFFADTTRLVVLLYKALVETGFALYDGTVITKQPLRELIASKTNSLDSSKSGSELEEARRQTELAKEVFSPESATALKNSGGASAGVFVEKISSWRDIAAKKLYGLRSTDVKFLATFCSMLATMRCKSGDKADVFRKGALISIKSLQQLFNDMWMKYSIKHMLTCRLNLASLEDLLAQLRVSGDNHPLPSPLTIVYRIRSLLLGNCVNQNPSKDLKHEHVLSKVLTANIPIHNPDMNAIKDGDLKILLSFTEEDHLKYLAALVATKFKGKYPELVDETGKKRNYTLPFWLQHLSCGNLTKASKYWLTHVKNMDKMFTFHHGADGRLKRSRKKNVTKRLVSYVMKRFKNVLPMEVIGEFVRQRTLVRIMHCNIKLTAKARVKRRNIICKKKVNV